MTELVIYGASDDLVEIEFDGHAVDEFNAYGPWRGVVESPEGERLAVTAEYGRPGAASEWTLGVENVDTRPEWPIRFGNRPGDDLDPALIITVPEGTTIKEISNA